MAEKKGGQWASEVYDFLQLFKRVNKSFSGLFLIELGWLLFLLLLSRLIPTGDPPIIPSLNLPVLGETSIKDLYLPGATLLIFIWIMTSRAWMYIWLPLHRIYRGLAITILFLTGLLLLLINIPLAIIALPIHHWDINRRFRKLSQENLEKRSAAIRDQINLELNLWKLVKDDAWVLCKIIRNKKDFEKISTAKPESPEYEAAVDGLIRQSIYSSLADESFPILFLMEFVQKNFFPVARNIYSQLIIGIAPLDSMNYGEELNASKAISQVFATTIQKMYEVRFQDKKDFQYVRFIVLPELVTPQNPNDASLLRKLTGLDLLLWGSYTTGNVSNIWLNVDQKSHKPSKNKDKDDESGKRGKRNFDAIFGQGTKLGRASFLIEQSDIWDTYISFILIVIQAINDRSFRSKREKKINWYALDNLYYASSDLDVVIEYLIWEVLRYLPDNKINLTDLLSPKRYLIEIAGNWIGNKLMHLDSGETTESVALQLLPIAQLCVELVPDIAENHYRLGTIYALLEKMDESVASFSSALQYESPNVFAKRSEHESEFEVEISINSNQGDKLSAGRLVAYIARYINIDGERGKQDIKRTMESKRWASYWKSIAGSDYGSLALYRVLLKLVSNAYTPRRGNQSFSRK